MCLLILPFRYYYYYLLDEARNREENGDTLDSQGSSLQDPLQLPSTSVLNQAPSQMSGHVVAQVMPGQIVTPVMPGQIVTATRPLQKVGQVVMMMPPPSTVPQSSSTSGSMSSSSSTVLIPSPTFTTNGEILKRTLERGRLDVLDRDEDGDGVHLHISEDEEFVVKEEDPFDE